MSWRTSSPNIRIKTGKRCIDCQILPETTASIQPISAKIRMLLKLLQDVPGDEKTIVFSQFTSFLNLIEPFLRSNGIRYVRCKFGLCFALMSDDGSMRNDKRVEALERIRSDPVIRVILISFKAGATGLNLTCCNNVILLDLWWNPA